MEDTKLSLKELVERFIKDDPSKLGSFDLVSEIYKKGSLIDQLQTAIYSGKLRYNGEDDIKDCLRILSTCYEKVGMHNDSLKVAEIIGDKKQIRWLYERKGCYDLAAKVSEEMGDLERAKFLRTKSSMYDFKPQPSRQ